MIKVKVTNVYKSWDLARQTRGRSSRWGDYQFFINTPVEECDYWIVHEKVTETDTTKCPPENVFFLSYEPPSIKNYNSAFLRQFASVFTPRTDLDHPNVISSQPAVPWFVGQHIVNGQATEKGQDYDELKNSPFPSKTGLIATITSQLNVKDGHKSRYDFVQQLKASLGDELAFFGRGTNYLPDKWPGIAPYKYHLAIENSRLPDYWTEKLADAFLAGAYPIYCGCPNITDYFPAGALTVIDIDNFEEALAVIRATIHSDRYEQAQADLQTAKNLVLDQYNFFPTVARLCAGSAINREKQPVTLHPEEVFYSRAERVAAWQAGFFRVRNDSGAGAAEYLVKAPMVNNLINSTLNSEEYAKDLEKELEKTRLEYNRLQTAYRETLGKVEKLEQANSQSAKTIKQLETELNGYRTPRQGV